MYQKDGNMSLFADRLVATVIRLNRSFYYKYRFCDFFIATSASYRIKKKSVIEPIAF